MLTHDQIRKLEQRKHRITLYELIAEAPGEAPVLAGYCQHGKYNILSMLRKHGEAWAQKMTDGDLLTFHKNGRGCQLGPIAIRFSGRTERDAIINGELPFFKED